MQSTTMFGKKLIYCEAKQWVMVYSASGLSQPAQDIIKAHYDVPHITIVLEDKE